MRDEVIHMVITFFLFGTLVGLFAGGRIFDNSDKLDDCQTRLAAEQDGKWHEYEWVEGDLNEWKVWWRNVENAAKNGEEQP